MILGRNLFSGLAASSMAALGALISIPVYIRYLGVEAYGLIAFYATLFALMQLFDLGLSPAMNREVAKQQDNYASARELLRTLEFICFGVAILIAACLFLASGWLAENWLRSTKIKNSHIQDALVLIGIAIATKWPSGLYQGVLQGAQRIVTASILNIFNTLLAIGGSLLLVINGMQDVRFIFVWFAIVTLVHTIIIRSLAWAALGGRHAQRLNFAVLRSIWRFSAGLTAISGSALLLSQLDKALLSNLLELDAFGRYMMAVTISGSLYLVVIPVFNVIYPRFSQLIAAREMIVLGETYHVGTRVLASVLFPLAMILVMAAKPLLSIWTGDPHLAERSEPLLIILTSGVALHGVMFVPHALQLAHGMTKPSVIINTVLLIVMIPLLVSMTLAFGERGAALSALLMCACYFALGSWVIHHLLMKGEWIRWLLKGVGWPLLVTVVVGTTGFLFSQALFPTPLARILFASLTGGCAMLILFLATPDRALLLNLSRFKAEVRR